MKPKKMDYEDFASVLVYSPETGEIRWKQIISNDKNKRVGMLAGTVKLGYLWITLNRKAYSAARVAWLLSHGSVDENMQIDHINRNGLDNRLCNLRLATSKENNNNRNNRFGESAPRYYTKHSSGQFQVRVKGKYIGLASSEDLAKSMVQSVLMESK